MPNLSAANGTYASQHEPAQVPREVVRRQPALTELVNLIRHVPRHPTLVIIHPCLVPFRSHKPATRVAKLAIPLG